MPTVIVCNKEQAVKIFSILLKLSRSFNTNTYINSDNISIKIYNSADLPEILDRNEILIRKLSNCSTHFLIEI